MKKLAKKINDLGEVIVALSDNPDEAYFESIGFTEQDVEKAYNNRWYLKEFLPQKPLAELKSEKRAEINKARDEAEQGGFEYMGKVFDSDPISCQRISCAAQAMQMSAMTEETPTIVWTCKDNTTIELNAQELMGLVVALAEWSNTCHEKATALKKQIEACQTPEELDPIKW